MCDHEFERFSIAFLGIRWQCIKCDLIAPVCFTPVFEAKGKTAQVDEILDEHLSGNPWDEHDYDFADQSSFREAE
jgi:hypothetical protein